MPLFVYVENSGGWDFSARIPDGGVSGVKQSPVGAICRATLVNCISDETVFMTDA
ncbi:hypothetical protein HU733_18160 [Pseudomonas paralactis]|uniref:hypothetical protein n=1 Tax=Pseudomonas paralactis TaxID=1615673 RepID=UPI000A71891C|nr:hypothetical protein [Pseudomonas paralactis]MBC3257427.1 hypothetical protein [Pseudomonas paralactis]